MITEYGHPTSIRDSDDMLTILGASRELIGASRQASATLPVSSIPPIPSLGYPNRN